MEFKSFGEIKRLGKVLMTITQKIHGTNAQVVIAEDGTVQAGSRTRWIYPHDDNFGFANWVEQNKEELIAKLGLGTHYGEWAGPGINSGEGLTEKTFVLFNTGRHYPDGLPPQTKLVPVLYHGPIDLTQIDVVMADLKENGSRLAPGFMRPEGVVVSFAGQRFKKVFDPEETQWTKGTGSKGKNPKTFVDFGHLCQPIRLEKLLSRDERYVRDFPKSLSDVVKDYTADLVKEGQITGTDDEIKSVRKGASSQIFQFVKTVMEERI